VRTDVKCEGRMEIAFSPDDNQAAILSKSLVTICDIMHPEPINVARVTSQTN